MTRATIIPVGEGKTQTHKVMLGDHEIGSSKTDFDARFHMHAINDALDLAYLEGQKYLERLIVTNRIEGELQSAITKARAEQYLKMEELRNERSQS